MHSFTDQELSAHDAALTEKAKAEAWDEGYMAVPAEPDEREFYVEDAPNPYRTLTPTPQERSKP